jgi:hypothetical protein
MSTLNNRILIKSVGFGDVKMYIELNSGRVLSVPYGIVIHLQKIVEDISVEGIIRDFGNETKRINISVRADFLDKADMYAKEHHLSRSALIEKATLEYIA